ncbi:sodium:proton antiporter [candidate division KSB1 bacterium]|nr:sodium:proton antiporter [candidate division KSB1 bacterium]
MTAPSPLWVIPFGLLLASIALGPLLAPRWWTRRYAWVALPLGALVAGYYAFAGAGERMLHVGHEYVSFIALIGSLYVVTGGMYVRLVGRLTPAQNAGMLAVGAVLANVVGTTGASMLLIRPYLRGNGWRFAPYHLVFFIFIVANCGGALTPIGDPPLFLGYLKGVPFFWPLAELWYKWLVGVALLIGMFYFFDRREYRGHSQLEQLIAEEPDRFSLDGKRNLIFVGVIVGAAFLQHPVFVREAIMVGAAAASYFLTPRPIHERNDFKFHPVREVAILFAGIFATMVPALDWLAAHAGGLGITTATHYYWLTGSLSAVLDNAPTYLNFLAAAMGTEGLSADNVVHVAQFARDHSHTLRSISIAAVYFGAATYIGNGPNFMCKSICEHAGHRAPSFHEYVFRYTLPVLLPVLVVTWLLVL